MAHNELKTDPEVFQLSWEGKKEYEIRYNDRDYQVGDRLVLRETRHSGEEMAAGKPLEYTGRFMGRQITSIVSGYGLEDGWVILSTSEGEDYKRQQIVELEAQTTIYKHALEQIMASRMSEDDWPSDTAAQSLRQAKSSAAKAIADSKPSILTNDEIHEFAKAVDQDQKDWNAIVDQLEAKNAIYTTALNNIIGFSSQGDSYAEAMIALTQPTTPTDISTQLANTQKTSGLLQNLNELKPGATVTFAGAADGRVEEIWEETVNHNRDRVKARAWIIHTDGSESYHTYRSDGRSHYKASADIVNITPTQELGK